MKVQPRQPQLIPALETKPQATGQAAVTARPDSFARGEAKPQVCLTMPPSPTSVESAVPLHPPEGPWYRFKKHVVLFLTGIDYDPHVHRLDDQARRRLSEGLEPGDVILRRTDGTTSNWVIPGYWGHAALYAGDGRIVDATTHDVREVDLAEFCSEGDAAIVVRPKGLAPEQVAEAIEYARSQIGKPYDFDLDFEDESRFTCTELVEKSLQKATGQGWAEGNIMGISPKDFLNDRFEFVWSSLGTMIK